MKKMNKKLNSEGFSLIELIIVISIMLILIGVMVPLLIQYVNKSKKSADVATADSIGSVFTYSMYDVSDPAGQALYKYVSKSADFMKKERRSAPSSYRVLAYMNVGYQEYELHLMNCVASNYMTSEEKTMINEKLQDVVQGLKYLQFTERIYLDQWIICCDEDMNIYVFVGGGVNDNRWYICSNDNGYSYYVNGNSSFNAYMVVPDTCQSYSKLKIPRDSHN